ncbi:glycerate kinase [Saccharothrix violaceirubra]|uniref:Glycerate kinase n=1 Tax=Saccharothrix violaceirubra TaxID=413306 RepID=A0A7W7T7S7_9PSEU|nr:glycerate kinase [Saccharothrix violaceirubra]MBB4968158.1 glycerate kinase [Saccharothrix violaceirubra]
MHVLIAPDSYKGSIPAHDAATALARGWSRTRPRDTVARLPVADGSDGTVDVLARAVPGAIRVPVPDVTGPDGRPLDAEWLHLPDGTAVVELARVGGLPLTAEPDPLGAHTIGLGELMAAALAESPSRLVVAVGDAAATDGGTGALRALGARFLDAFGTELPPGAAHLTRLHRVELDDLPEFPRIDVLVDVDHTLKEAPTTGNHATPHEAKLLSTALTRLAEALPHPQIPGTGAAGGTAYGLAAALDARLTPGADFVGTLLDLPAHLAQADLVITGEGAYDATSQRGKAVGHILTLARTTPKALVAGRLDIPPPPVPTVTLVSLATRRAAAFTHPVPHLHTAAAILARTLHP